MQITADVSEPVVIDAQEETPRMKCLKKCQAEHLTCLAAAGDDPNKTSACNKKLSECEKGCPKN